MTIFLKSDCKLNGNKSVYGGLWDVIRVVLLREMADRLPNEVQKQLMGIDSA